MARLKQIYRDKIKAELQKKFGYGNPMQVPGLVKVVISMGLAEASKDKNAIQDCLKELSQLSGQKSLLTKAKKAISNFKLREDQPIGAKVTLRGERMFDFVYRFINVACPRIRDFRGFGTKCDGRGNFSLGIDDQQIFPEINLDEVKRTQGMHITFVTSAETDEECVELLRLLGLPFKDRPIVVNI
jgi:large subunit ribosomal protein L5